MLELKNLAKKLDRHSLLSDVSLTLQLKERLSILGPTGSGKTSLLRVIMGLDPIDGGEIRSHGRLLSQPGEIAVPPDRRGFSLVFEKTTLLPFMSVQENICVGARPGDRTAGKRLEALLDLLDLQALRGRPSHTLSGGEGQRVALARSLFVEPSVLLLDEPFRQIDRPFRDAFIPTLCRYLTRQGTAAILVTHDRDEAFSFGQRIALLTGGCLIRCDTAPSLYARPGGEQEARLLGECNLLPRDVAFDLLGISPTDPDAQWILIRPEQLTVSEEPPHNATLSETRFFGFYTTLVFAVKEDMSVLVYVLADVPFTLNERYRLRLKPGAAVTTLPSPPSTGTGKPS